MRTVKEVKEHVEHMESRLQTQINQLERLIKDATESNKNKYVEWSLYACPTCTHWAWYREDKSADVDGDRGECVSMLLRKTKAGALGLPTDNIYVPDYDDIENYEMPLAGECEGYHRRH